jgi:peptidoglycan hydrolase CwlO-like protein
VKKIYLVLLAAMAANTCLGAPTEDYQNKIAGMQKSIASLREEIARIRTERNNLQLKMEQSDQAIASQLQKITAIQNSIAENKKTIEALETEKKS